METETLIKQLEAMVKEKDAINVRLAQHLADKNAELEALMVAYQVMLQDHEYPYQVH